MRTRITLVTVALMLMAVTTAHAQAQSAEPRTTIGAFDFSVQSTDITGNPAAYRRFRDIRNGSTLERVRFDRAFDGWRVESSADHLGRRDQRMFASVITSKVKASFLWDQIPLFTNDRTRSPYRADANGVFRLDDALQLGLQAGQPLSNAVSFAGPLELTSRRHIAAFDLLYSATRELDLRIKVQETRRDGSQPFGAPIAMANTVEIAAPIDSRTRDINAQLEWSAARGRASVGYDGSWFDNRIQSLVWDNPLRLEDGIVSGAYVTGQGRLALAPSNTSQGATVAGSLSLPWKTRVSAHARTGLMWQNEPLLAPTVNSLIPAPSMPRPTADAEVRTVTMNYSLTSRPVRYVWFNVRYRYYDFDNRTESFEAHQRVSLDSAVRDAHPTTYVDYTRDTLDVDASLTPLRHAAFRFGYTHQNDDRSNRLFERTREDTYRASVDSSVAGLTLRAIAERGERRGRGLHEEELTAVGEQPGMRHFDIADRDRTRLTGLLQYAPIKAIAVAASAAAGADEYNSGGFGLRDNRNRTYTGTVDILPFDKLAAGASYTWERYTALQNSRNVSSAAVANDATRDWSFDSADKSETVSANVDLVKLIPRTDVRLTYDHSRSTVTYVYRVPLDTTLAPIAPLPPVRNELKSLTGEVRYFVTRQLAVGAVYWYDDYVVEDFARSASAIGGVAHPSALFLGSLYEPYTARSASLRIMWLW